MEPNEEQIEPVEKVFLHDFEWPPGHLSPIRMATELVSMCDNNELFKNNERSPIQRSAQAESPWIGFKPLRTDINPQTWLSYW